jgi:hypothetical protein
MCLLTAHDKELSRNSIGCSRVQQTCIEHSCVFDAARPANINVEKDQQIGGFCLLASVPSWGKMNVFVKFDRVCDQFKHLLASGQMLRPS